MLEEELAQLVAVALWAAVAPSALVESALVESALAGTAAVVLARAVARDTDAPWTAVERARAAARPSRRRC
jgi:hypothetical protein